MIDILLATYNGEKFIDTQISSIVNQTYKAWNLYIHDDGSTDSTVEKIRQWAALDSRIIFIEDGLVFHNPGMHFLHLMKHSTADLICFSDQDDLWLENKLSVMRENINEFSNEPKLVVCGCYLWKSEENLIVPKLDFSRAYNLYEFLFLNGGLQGCAMMFNKSLLKISLQHNVDFIYMHDHFISLCAYSFGEINFIGNRLFLYRQHTANASIHIEKTKAEHIKKVLSNSCVPVIYQNSFLGVKSFFTSYENDFSKSIKRILEQYLSFDKMNPCRRFFRILCSDFCLGHKKHFKLILKLIARKWRDQNV